MKSTITLPVTALPLYCVANGTGSSAQQIMPFPFDCGAPVVVTGEFADDNLGGNTIVTLLESELEMDAFAAGLDLANPGNDCTWQKYELDGPVDGCRFVVVFHNSDGDNDLSIQKFAEEAKMEARRKKSAKV